MCEYEFRDLPIYDEFGTEIVGPIILETAEEKPREKYNAAWQWELTISKSEYIPTTTQNDSPF